MSVCEREIRFIFLMIQASGIVMCERDGGEEEKEEGDTVSNCAFCGVWYP